MKIKIGFDIGGTNIKAGLFDEKLQVLAKKTMPFRKADYHEIAKSMNEIALEMCLEKKLDSAEVASVGVAVAGTVNDTDGTVVKAVNLKLYQVPFKKELQQYFPVAKISLLNDADAAVIAEWKHGSLKGYQNALLLTLGTGIGGGMIFGGRLHRGGHGHGFEPGHMTLNPDGPLCACGNRGCADVMCSATWLTNQGYADAKSVIDLAKAGDLAATEIFGKYLENLSYAIASLTALFDPEIIALGGGVSLAGDFLFDAIRKEVFQKSFFEFAYKIVPAQLGNDAGIIGAAASGDLPEFLT